MGAGLAQSWRELAHTPAHQVPVLLGAVGALLFGILTYLFDAAREGTIVAALIHQAYLMIFGVVAMIGYRDVEGELGERLHRGRHRRFGAIGPCGDAFGLFVGLLLLPGAI